MKTTDKEPESSHTSQREKFEATARELGADEDEAAFEAKLKKLGKHKPVKGEPDGK